MANYQKTFEIIWADLDPNFHVRHTAYNDYAAQVRFGFLSENGYNLEKFREKNIGPVVFREDTKFLREVHAGDKITIDLKMEVVGEDWRKWKIHHNIFRKDGVKAAEIDLDGAWLDTNLRKVVPAPDDLIEAIKKVL